MNTFLKSILALLIAAPALVYAHTGVSGSIPKSGSELAESPKFIEIQFHEGAKLTSLVVVGPDKQERKLTFVASEKPNAFRANEPKLVLGVNEVQWKALSKDGHVATGKLTFIVKPAAKAN